MNDFPGHSHRADFKEVVERVTKTLTEQKPALPWVRHLMGGHEPLIAENVARIIDDGMRAIQKGETIYHTSGGVRIFFNEDAGGTIEVSVLAGRWNPSTKEWSA